MDQNMSRANIYCKEMYGYSLISLLLFKGNNNVKKILASIDDASELLVIYAIVDSIVNGKEN